MHRGIVYRIDEIEAEPLRLNANLGDYTNFVDLLDLCAIAIPNGFPSNGIPSGVTFISPPIVKPISLVWALLFTAPAMGN